MKLVIITFKDFWKNKNSGEYLTNGGFPFQIEAIANLFDEARLITPLNNNSHPDGLIAIKGENLTFWEGLKPLPFQGWKRKILFFPWFIYNFYYLKRGIEWSDAVHVPLMGDIPIMAMCMSLIMKKKLFVRHCGNWFEHETVAKKIVKWLMEKYASKRNVMFVTGGGLEKPSSNSHIHWIFSTSLTKKEIQNNKKVKMINSKKVVNLLVVCRQYKEKGTEDVIRAMKSLICDYNIHLTILGDGPDLLYFKKLVNNLNINEHITFKGHVDPKKVISYFKQTDIFCFPTVSSEGFPKVVLESLSCGVPVLTTPISVLPYLLKKGGGIILEKPYADDLVEKIRKLIIDKELYSSLSKQALSIANEYSLENWQFTIKRKLEKYWGSPLKKQNNAE